MQCETHVKTLPSIFYVLINKAWGQKTDSVSLAFAEEDILKTIPFYLQHWFSSCSCFKRREPTIF